MNKVFISGRLTKDVEKQTSSSGGEYVRFSVAVDKFSKDKEKKTIFVDCIAFTHSANFLAKYCRKGSKVYVEGELDANIVENEGKRTTYWTVIAYSIEADKPKTEVAVEETSPTLPTFPIEDESNGAELPFEM